MSFQHDFLNCLKSDAKFTRSMSSLDYLPNSVDVSTSIAENLPFIQGYKKVSCIYPYYYSASDLNSYCLLLTNSGSGTLTIGDNKYLLESNSLAFIDCMVPHRLDINHRNWTYYVLFFHGKEVNFFHKLITEETPVVLLPVHTSLPSMFKKLFEQLDNTSKNSLVISKFIIDIIYEILLENNQLIDSESKIPSYLREIKNKFDANYFEDYSLEQLEQDYGISRYRICREFQKYYNESPIQYLNHKRIAVAKDNLLHTDKRINEIGQLVGFENTNHFIRLFKKQTGVTPLEYRKQQPGK